MSISSIPPAKPTKRVDSSAHVQNARVKAGPVKADPDWKQLLQAIRLWTEWDVAHERLTEQLYRLGPGPAIETKMDQLDQLRHRARTISQRILQRHSSP